jgi:threonine dehydrogenase-like Zn-dependent dehydrogenase
LPSLQIQQQMSIRPTDQVLVIGAGRLGQMIAQTLTLTGCHFQVVARYPKQRQLLATRQIPWLAENQVTDNRFDLVVEATGSSSGFTLAQQAVRPRGTIILKSTYAGSEIPVNFSSLVVAEITVIGCRCGPFAPALRLL